jgi:hypothetical protein
MPCGCARPRTVTDRRPVLWLANALAPEQRCIINAASTSQPLPLVRIAAHGALRSRLHPCWRFQLGSQHPWIRQRYPGLAISGAFTTGQLFKLDHYVAPAGKVGAGRRALRGDNSCPGPGKAAKRRPIGIGGYDDDTSVVAGLPGIRDRHPDQIGHSDRAGVIVSATLHATLRTSSFSTDRWVVQLPQLPPRVKLRTGRRRGRGLAGDTCMCISWA